MPKNVLPGRRIDKPHRFPDVVREHEDEKQREIKEISVHILHDEREGALTEVSLARLTDRARGRIGPKGFVVGAAVVITGEPKSAGSPKNEQRR